VSALQEMATQEYEAPTLAPGGEPCPGCGSPLAGDQRYCLECGTRRPEAVPPFRRGARVVERTVTQYPDPPAAAVAEPRTGLTFLAGLACLLLALGVGVLIGRAGQKSTPAKASAPQVISVGGAAPAATTTPASTGAAGTATPAKAKKAKAKAAKDKTPTAKSAKDSHATNKSLKSLSNLSGKDYQKKASKLPKTVGTGGKAPPIDKSKPAGGGSAVESIG
jgi:hypothetical protein